MIYETQVRAAYEKLRARLPQADHVATEVTLRVGSPDLLTEEWWAKVWRDPDDADPVFKYASTAKDAIEKAVKVIEAEEQSILDHAARIRARLTPGSGEGEDQAEGLRQTMSADEK